MDVAEYTKEELSVVVHYLMGRAGLHPDWTPPWLEKDAEFTD